MTITKERQLNTIKNMNPKKFDLNCVSSIFLSNLTKGFILYHKGTNRTFEKKDPQSSGALYHLVAT
jgi:hypothetical protein